MGSRLPPLPSPGRPSGRNAGGGGAMKRGVFGAILAERGQASVTTEVANAPATRSVQYCCAQCRQPRSALCAGRQGTWRLCRARIRRRALKVKHIVVLGHARCGGIRAFAEEAAPLSPGDFIGQLDGADGAGGRRRSARAGQRRWTTISPRLEQASVVQTLDNLMTFPACHSGRERGKLATARRLFRRRQRPSFGVGKRQVAGLAP